jgi:hypothetical protein
MLQPYLIIEHSEKKVVTVAPFATALELFFIKNILNFMINL